MSHHDLIRFIRFVSRFTFHLCNAIFFPTTFNTSCKRFTKFLEFWSLELNTPLVYLFLFFFNYTLLSLVVWSAGGAGESDWMSCCMRVLSGPGPVRELWEDHFSPPWNWLETTANLIRSSPTVLSKPPGVSTSSQGECKAKGCWYLKFLRSEYVQTSEYNQRDFHFLNNTRTVDKEKVATLLQANAFLHLTGLKTRIAVMIRLCKWSSARMASFTGIKRSSPSDYEIHVCLQ